MRPMLMLVLMIFLHVLADFHLQGVLAEMKQKKWWEKQVKNLENSSHRLDYRMAMMAHAFEWAFLITLPCGIVAWRCITEGFEMVPVMVSLLYLVLLCLNVVAHYETDDAKANRNRINLVGDQFIHLVQIFVTWGIWTVAVWW